MRNLKYVFIANGGPKHLNLILFGFVFLPLGCQSRNSEYSIISQKQFRFISNIKSFMSCT